MGFFQILRSIEDLLYEIMTWLVFYPRTLWQVIRHPIKMSGYSDQEQSDSRDQQYTDTLSPPLFLILTILVSHGLELAFQTNLDTARTGIGKAVLNSDENLLILRSILFSIYPLMFAVGMLKHSDKPLDRTTLRAPFFSQCYLGALLVLLVSVAAIMLRAKLEMVALLGMAMGLFAIIWFLWVQTIWLAEHLNLTHKRGALLAIGTFLKASIINSGFAAIFFV